ncbi:MAG: protein kinase [Acidobacteriota bacterium]|nr:protein kinase [Acidobacteriota bacterium]
MLTSGKILDGRYHIRERIGSGGFGAVYLAEDTRFSGKNLVAVKEIQPRSEREASSLRLEADLLYNLSHPNLPKVSNCFQENGAYFIVMDYITGEDLAEMLKRGKRFETAEVLRVADTVLDALEYLHSFPVFHRDIKPHNIKIDETGKIFLLDFGTAKGNLEDDVYNKPGLSITGFTPFYAPLEQVLRVDTNSFLILQAEHEVHLQRFLNYRTDERSDIYALAATIFHLLSGVSPSNATSTFRARALWSNQPDPLPRLSTLNPEVSAHLSRILQTALTIEPANRFQTAREFRNALQENSFSSDKTLSFIAETQPSPLNFDSNSAGKITGAATEILTGDKLESIAGILPPNETKLDSKKKFLAIGAAVLILFLFGIAGAGIWFFVGGDSATIPEKPTENAAENATQSNPQLARSVHYSLLVQKMRDGKKFQEPFESSGQEIFENGYRFQMRLTASENGFLYLFNEGLNDKSEKVFQIIFPTPLTRNGSAEVGAEQKIETGWNEFDGKAGTENFWIIWNKEKIDIIEKVIENAFLSDTGAVTDKVLEGNLREFIGENKKSETKTTKDVERKLSVIDFDGDSVAHLLQLEHR